MQVSKPKWSTHALIGHFCVYHETCKIPDFVRYWYFEGKGAHTRLVPVTSEIIILLIFSYYFPLYHLTPIPSCLLPSPTLWTSDPQNFWLLHFSHWGSSFSVLSQMVSRALASKLNFSFIFPTNTFFSVDMTPTFHPLTLPSLAPSPSSYQSQFLSILSLHCYWFSVVILPSCSPTFSQSSDLSLAILNLAQILSFFLCSHSQPLNVIELLT